MYVRSGLAVGSAVKSEAVLPLHGGHAVEAGEGGGREDGEGDGVLQSVLLTVRPALILPLVRQTDIRTSTDRAQFGGNKFGTSILQKVGEI